MFAVDAAEINAEGAFFGLEVDRVELPLHAVAPALACGGSLSWRESLKWAISKSV